jgi:tetratricopeptide (TPR) repeat protein
MKRSAVCLLSMSILLSLNLSPALSANEIPTAQQARDLYKDGKYSEAQQAYELLISSKRNAEVKEQRQYAELLLGYGRSLTATHKFDEAFKMLSQALAICEAFALPGEFTAQVKADVESARPKLSRPLSPHYSSASNYNADPQRHDAAEREHLCKAAIEFARDRYGALSMTYLLRQLEYAKFLAEQHRTDDLAKQASICRDVFAKLPPESQTQTAPQVIEFAENLAQNNLPLDADTIGSIVMTCVTNGGIRNGTEISNNLERLASALDRAQASELAQKYYAASVRAFEKQVPADDPRLAKMRDSLAGFYKKVGKNGAAIELLELTVAAQSKNIMTGSPEAVNSLATLTELYCLTSNLPKAKESASRLAEALTHAPDDGRVSLTPLFDAAKLLAAKGDLGAAETLYTSAFNTIKHNRNNRNDYELQKQVKDLATQMGGLGHPEQAEKIYDAYIATRSTSLGQPTAASVAVLIEKSTFFLEQEMYDKAAVAARAASDLNKRFTNSNQDSRLNDLARQFVQRKQYDVALVLEQSYLDGLDGGHNVNDYQLVDAKTRLATIYHQLGRDPEAMAILHELSTRSSDRLTGKLEPVKPILQGAVDKLLKAGKMDQAIELLTTTGQLSSYSQPSDGIVRVVYTLTQQQLLDESQQLLDLSLAIQKEAHGASSNQVANILRESARVFGLKGDEAKSAELTTAAQSIFILQQRQMQVNPGGTEIYNPSAPLADTVKAAAALGATSSQMIRRGTFVQLNE